MTGPAGADAEALHAAVRTICGSPRALTGDGARRTLDLLRRWVPELETVEVPSGTEVLDWTVPPEWNLRRARLTGPDGAVVADTDVEPLAVVGYADPVDVHLPLEELQPHLHSLPDRPDLTPWRTTYYAPGWGFCLPHRVRERLSPGTYHAVVDATLAPGSLSYGEAVLPGEEPAEVLVTAHICHPAMANDNASGNVVAAAVYAALAARPARRLTYRFLFAPGTIGAITWLARSGPAIDRTLGVLVLSGLADPGPLLTYKRSRRGDAPVDRAARVALADLVVPHQVADHTPWGYDERQFNSLGFDLGAGLLSRTPHGTYPEYHTSADDPSFVVPQHLATARDVVLGIVDALEADVTYRNTQPYGEPQLGRRGLYDRTGGGLADTDRMAMLWVLGEADGTTGLLAIAERSGVPIAALRRASDALAAAGLLERVGAA